MEMLDGRNFRFKSQPQDTVLTYIVQITCRMLWKWISFFLSESWLNPNCRLWSITKLSYFVSIQNPIWPPLFDKFNIHVGPYGENIWKLFLFINTELFGWNVPWMSGWWLFNARWAIFQLYHGVQVTFNEMIMISALYLTNTHSWIFIVLTH